MFLNTLQVVLKQRQEDANIYHLRITPAILDILFLIFEFKIATSWHISRFLVQKDQDKYIYFKLRKMWEVGLLESFKVYAGTTWGMPVYYMLSKDALDLLKEQGKYDPTMLKNYPKAKTLLSWGLFMHEAEVVELASMEAKNNSESLKITFSGEMNSGGYEFRSDKNIEVFTPDYTATYSIRTKVVPIYTEYERTLKSTNAMIRKVGRYVQYLDREKKAQTGLRFIFQTPEMEKSFWLRILTEKAYFLNHVNIFSTNILLLNEHTKFLDLIYANEQTVKFTRDSRLRVDIPERVKLFPFL